MPETGERVRTSPITPDADRRTAWTCQHPPSPGTQDCVASRCIQAKVAFPLASRPTSGGLSIGGRVIKKFELRAILPGAERSKGWLHCWAEAAAGKAAHAASAAARRLKIHPVRHPGCLPPVRLCLI